MANTIIHKKSKNLVNGVAKLPTAEQLQYGELAINYYDGQETITIKNSENEIVTFKTEEYNEQQREILRKADSDTNARIDEVYTVIEDNEEIVAESLNELNARVTELEGAGVTVDSTLSADSTNAISNAAVTAKFNEVNTEIAKKANADDLAGKQDKIDDLAAIREGAGKGATAIQESDLADYVKTETLSDYVTTGALATELSKLDIPTESDIADMGFTKNVGTVTGVKMNGTAMTMTDGVVDLGTVITNVDSLATKTELNEGVAKAKEDANEYTDTEIEAVKAIIVDNEEITANSLTQLDERMKAVEESSVIVDEQLSTTSTNAIQNKTVTETLNKLSSDISGVVTALPGKQDKISDLETIRSGAAAGATAIQEAQLNAALSGYTTTTAFETEMAKKLDKDTFDALVNGNASEAIDTFNEITAFLSGVTNTESFEGIIGGFETQLSGKAEAEHNHDDLYYGKATIDTNINKAKEDANAYADEIKDEILVIIEEDEKVTANGLTDLDERVTELENATIVADEQFSTTSANAIQNKTVTAEFNKVNSSLSSMETTLNSKQDKITDLDTIRNGASAGATAVQPATLTSTLSGYTTTTAFNTELNKKADKNDVPTEQTVTNWGFTKNTGTITEIKMNGASLGTSGSIDLGTVITDVSNLAVKAETNEAIAKAKEDANAYADDIKDEILAIIEEDEKVTANGLTDLDERVTELEGATIVADEQLSTTSVNAIQNKTVTETFNKVNTDISNINTSLNGKQATISDLSTIRSGAAAGATAVQPATLTSTLTAYTTTATFNSELAKKADKAVLDALVSGNTSTAINSFNEITAFLSGVTDTESFKGIIAGFETQLSGKSDSGHNHDDWYYRKATVDTNINKAKEDANAYTDTEIAKITDEIIKDEKTISNSLTQLDARITELEENGVELDSALSTTSTNGIQNAVVTNALSKKANSDEVYTQTETNNLLAGKQATISDLTTIRSGASAGATAVQPATLSAYTTTATFNSEIAKKANTSDLYTKSQIDTSISNARTSAVTESKAYVDQEIAALSEEIVKDEKAIAGTFNDVNTRLEALEGERVALIEFNDTSIVLEPNKYYRLTTAKSSLSISLGTPSDETILNEYFIEFPCSSTTVSLPSTLKWANGETPSFDNGITYQISIVNNLAVFAAFE